MIRALTLLAVLSALAPAVAKELAQRPDEPRVELAPLPDEKAVPFGPAVVGLACRVIVPADVVHGQAVSFTAQVKNVGDHDLYVLDELNPLFKTWVTLAITGPAGRLGQTSSAGRGLTPSSFVKLAPGESRRFDLTDLRSLFTGGATLSWREGRYSIDYTFEGPALPERASLGTRTSIKDGKQVQEEIYDQATPEQRRFAWSGKLSSNTVCFDLNALKDEDLAVHEWGVFTVFNDVKYANINRQAEWSGLPDTFYRQFPKQRIKWMPAVWDKPIVYFYSKRSAMNVNLKVKFADGGAPVVWWPCASEPVNNSGNQYDAVPRFDSLHWDLWLGDRVPASQGISFLSNGSQWAQPRLADLPAESWLNSARLSTASLVTTGGSGIGGRRPFNSRPFNSQTETERFVFYDGLVPAPDFLRCGEIAESSATLKNTSAFDMPHVYVIDRRKGTMSAGTAVLPAGHKLRIELAAADAGTVEKSLRADLLHAGLFEPEADALMKIWHKGFFENTGVVAFYVIPQAQYDRMLPMEIDPRPARSPVRVGIAFQPNLEADPVIAGQVAALIGQLDDPDYHKRNQAMRALARIGLEAVRPLTQAKASASVNARLLIDDALQQIGAVKWMTSEVPAGERPVNPAGQLKTR
jgi:hypothetical protein